jgi:arsenate reductase
MAEGWLRTLGGDRFEACSAGTQPVGLNPRAVSAMADVGVDISGHVSENIEVYLTENPPDLVISVCDSARESCPVFPARTQTAHWPFTDPSDPSIGATGNDEVVAAEFARVRDAIRERIDSWLAAGAPLETPTL